MQGFLCRSNHKRAISYAIALVGITAAKPFIFMSLIACVFLLCMAIIIVCVVDVYHKECTKLIDAYADNIVVNHSDNPQRNHK